MHCKYCGFVNGEEDHRCLRCGRRVGVAISAPLNYSGNNALAMRANPNATTDNDSQELFTQMPYVAPPAAGVPTLESQPSLFQAQPFQAQSSNVIPFRQAGRPVTLPVEERPKMTVSAPEAKAAPQSKPAARKASATTQFGAQTTMDFTTVSLPKPRVLQDSVTSEIYTARPVAARMLRLAAGMLDIFCILFASGVFCVGALALGANFGEGKFFWMTLAGAVALIALTYSLLWSIVGPETFGMRELGLELINFNGQPLDARTRLLRTPTSWLSFCAAGLGIIWSLFDEETLTLHDHISKSFPTQRDGSNSIVRERR